MNPKKSQLQELAFKRKATQEFQGKYRQISEFHQGRYECDFVSPYTKTAGNLDSPLFILLQDWASADFLEGSFRPEIQQHGREPHLATNTKLDKLVLAHFQRPIAETFATNLFPFAKPGKMSSKIPAEDIVRCATEFAVPQIEIIKPRLVIALGLACFNAMRKAIDSGSKAHQQIAIAIENPIDYRGVRIWCQAHTSPLGQNTRNRRKDEQVPKDRNHQVIEDWKTMAEWFKLERAISR